MANAIDVGKWNCLAFSANIDAKKVCKCFILKDQHVRSNHPSALQQNNILALPANVK